jgi:hypothetical protein
MLSANKRSRLRLGRPNTLPSAPLKLFSLRLVFILLAACRKKLEAAPLLATKQLQDYQIPFSGEETKLAALAGIDTF